ncbi:MAG: thioredoxin family protein [Nitrospirae bacterium]|nr:thioredoxin family protein [Nitrospirota bacterium]
MIRKNLVFIACFYVLFAAAPAVAEIHWYSLADGLKMAAGENKPVLVDFYFGKGCPRCESLQKNVYDNPAIGKKISDDFIPVRIDLNKKLTAEETALGNQYDYKNDCLLLFLDQSGKLVKGPGGKKLCFADAIDPELFIQYLDMVRAGYK